MSYLLSHFGDKTPNIHAFKYEYIFWCSVCRGCFQSVVSLLQDGVSWYMGTAEKKQSIVWQMGRSKPTFFSLFILSRTQAWCVLPLTPRMGLPPFVNPSSTPRAMLKQLVDKHCVLLPGASPLWALGLWEISRKKP